MDKFAQSRKRFDSMETTKRKCLWEIHHIAGNRFELECWQMDDGSVAIFQIFADNGGFMKYVPEK